MNMNNHKNGILLIEKVKKVYEKERRKIKASNNDDLRMLYCYVGGCNKNCPPCLWQRTPNKLTIKDYERLIKEGKNIGVTKFKLGGGEPFSREDIVDIIKLAKIYDLEIIVETNGTFFDQPLIKKLAKIGLELLIMSLDGNKRDTYYKMRGQVYPNEFEKLTRNIVMCCKEGINTRLVSTASIFNYTELIEIAKWAFDNEVNSYKIIFNILPLGKGELWKDKEITLNQAISLVPKLWNVKRRYKKDIFVTLMPPLLPLKVVEMASPDCFWAKHFMAILPNGDLSICGFGNWNFPELRKENIFNTWRESKELRDVWQGEFFNKLRNLKPHDFHGVCGKCVINEFCRGSCRLLAYSWYRDIRSPYPSCQIAYEQGLFPFYALRH